MLVSIAISFVFVFGILSLLNTLYAAAESRRPELCPQMVKPVESPARRSRV